MIVAPLLVILAQAPISANLDAAGLAALVAADGAGAVVALADGVSVPSGERAKAFKSAGVRVVPGVTGGAPAVAYSDHLPFAAMEAVAKLGIPGQPAPARLASFPRDVVKNARVTLKTANGAGYRVASLAEAPWSLPLTISPAFNEERIGALVLAANVQGMPELDFLRAVAKAVGGRFRQNGKAYFIEPNGAELRLRALRTVEVVRAAMAIPAPTPRGEGGGDRRRPRGNRGESAGATTAAGVAARLDFARDAVSLVAPDALEGFFDGRLSTLEVSLLGAAALQQDLLRIMTSDAGDQGDAVRVQRIAASVPAQNPGVVRISDGFSMDVRLNVAFGRSLRTEIVRAL